jgi:hypothetical protein
MKPEGLCDGAPTRPAAPDKLAAWKASGRDVCAGPCTTFPRESAIKNFTIENRLPVGLMPDLSLPMFASVQKMSDE